MDRRDFMKMAAALPCAAMVPSLVRAAEQPLSDAYARQYVNRYRAVKWTFTWIEGNDISTVMIGDTPRKAKVFRLVPND